MSKSVVERVYEYLPYDWTLHDASDLQADVEADISAAARVAFQVPFTPSAVKELRKVEHLRDVYDVLGVLAEEYPFIASVEDAWAEVQRRREESGK